MHFASAKFQAYDVLVGRKNGAQEEPPTALEETLIPTASTADRRATAALADKCLDARGINRESWEETIDARPAALHGL